MKQKDLGISTVRILAMVGIIVCHTVMYYQFIPQHENLGQLFNCGVGIFIFISGLLYGANIRKSFGLNFFKKRWLRVCLPVVIWGTFVFLLDGCRNFCYWIVLLLNLQGINFIVENPIFNTAITGTGPLWFVTVIMLCYLMLPLLEKIRSNWSIGRIKAFVLGSWVVQVFAGLGGVQLDYFSIFILGFFWWQLFPNYRRKISKSKGKSILLILIMVIVIGLRIISRHYVDGSNLYDKVIVSLTMTVFEIAFILFILGICDRQENALEKISNTRFFRFLDTNNFYLYIVHPWFIVFTYEKIGLLPATVVFIFAINGASIALHGCTDGLTNLIKKKRVRCEK